MRSAAVEAIAKVGVGPLEAQLKTVLQGATPSSTYPFVVLYRLLGNSDDPSMAAVFADSLKGIPVSREADFFNGIQHSRKPWLRALLLEATGILGCAPVPGPHCWRPGRRRLLCEE